MVFVDKSGGAVFPFNQADVFDAVVESIQRLRGMHVKEANKPYGYIKVSVGASLISWGEDIPISITGASPSQTCLNIVSSSKFAIIDWGKNKKNIENIINGAAEILYSKAQTGEIAQEQCVENAIKLCPHCSMQLPAPARFCSYCGKQL